MEKKDLQHDVILIINHDQNDRKVLSEIVQNWGFTVTTVRNGEEALNKMKERLPDLIFLEYQQENHEACQICGQFKKRKKYKQIPIIFTIHEQSSYKLTDLFRMGGSDYVIKPFHPDEILTRINIHLSFKKMQNKLGEQSRELGMVRKTNREELRRLSTIVQQSPISVIITDTNGTIEYVNPIFTEVTGYQYDEMIGKNPRILNSGFQSESFYQELWKTIKKGEIWQGEFANKKKSGEIYWDKTTIAPMKDDRERITHYIGIKEDISERKKIDEDLQRRITELATARRDMLNMMEDLEASKVKAEEATRAKSDFLANMSHEIRTPMNAIIGLTHLVLKTDLSEKQFDFIKKIDCAAKSLLGIINDILDFSKIEAGKLNMEEVDFNLNEVLNNLSKLVSVKTEEKGLEFLFDISPETPISLRGDPLRLSQILLNLANNAIKFTEQGEIVVSARSTKIEKDWVEILFSVKDTGIGMTEEHQSKLFQSFQQADSSTTRQFGGTGLGLVICKKIIELLGGSIHVNSKIGEGSEFYFTANFKQQNHETKGTVIPESLRNLKILIVDDNRTFRSIMKKSLEIFGFQADQTFSGKQALAGLKRANRQGNRPYDLLFLDWNMPGMGGFETIHQIQTDETLTKKPKIIIATGYGREDVLKQAEEIHPDGFLLKPVTQSLLFDTIMETFGEKVGDKKENEADQTMVDKSLKSIRGTNILLVEDNQLSQQIVSELLEDEGFSVTVVVNGKEAIRELEQSFGRKKFDLVLMDLQMPVMDGFTTTEQLRNDKRFEKLPIIAMTAEAMFGVREKTSIAGMNGYISKPIDPELLLRTLKKWIKPKKRKKIKTTQTTCCNIDQKSLNTLAKLPEVDMKSGVARIGGKHSSYIRLLCTFYQSNFDIIHQIRRDISKENFENLEMLIHRLKGVFGNISAFKLQEVAMKLEKLIKARKMAQVHPLLNQLQELLTPLLDGIEKLRQSSAIKKDSRTIKHDMVKIRSIIKQIEQLLAEDDMEAEEFLPDLKRALSNRSFAGELKELENHMDRYDFKDATKVLKEIKLKLNTTVEEV